jgi:hypothetical protein
MAKKVVGLYGDIASQSPFNSDQLFIEVGLHHVACIVKMSANSTFGAIEVFHFNSNEENWYDIFQTIRSKSRILDRGYIDTRVFYNLPETVIVPFNKFSPEAAEGYLQLMHGDTSNHVLKYDEVKVTPSVVVAYKIRRALSDTVNSNLMMITTRHTFSNVIEDVLSPGRPYNHTLLKVQFYNKEMTMALVHNEKLLLVQTYEQNAPEDALYYMLNVLQQFNLPTEEATIELSGNIEVKTPLYDKIKKVFPKINFENLNEEFVFATDFEDYPKHYLTPYFNLVK